MLRSSPLLHLPLYQPSQRTLSLLRSTSVMPKSAHNPQKIKMGNLSIPLLFVRYIGSGELWAVGPGMVFRRQNLGESLMEMIMLKITVQKLGDTSVLRCHGRIVAGDAGSILRNAVLSQRQIRLLVIDLARVELIDAGGLGVLLDLRQLTRSSAIMFKLMNATKRVEEILELTHLQRAFEFCSVRELFCLLHRTATMASCSADQSNRTDENDSRNDSVGWSETVPAV